MLAGADVGGLYLSTNRGATFHNVSHSLDTLQIQDIVFSRDTAGTAYLATAGGVYSSTDYKTWTALNTGFSSATGSDFDHPIQTVVVDPSKTNILWAGVGEGTTPLHDSDRTDPYQVYRSTDSGSTWSPVLTIAGAVVFKILVHPVLSNRVWVGSSKGLYFTTDGGTTWTELGIEDPQRSSDGGSTWSSCATAGCPAAFTAPCTSGTDCLPVITSAGETHPNIRDLKLVAGSLYVTIWDSGHASEAGAGCDAAVDQDYFNDSALDYYRGGPYRSSDGGLSFDWLLKPGGTVLFDAIRYRCDASGDETWDMTSLPFVEINPSNPDQVILGAFGLRGGIYELDLAASTYSWYADCDTSTSAVDYTCFEGGQSQGISGNQTGPSMFKMLVESWSSHPRILFTHSRGLVRATWDSTNSRYGYDHLYQTSADISVSPTRWTSSGLDDTCVTGGVAQLTLSGTDYLFAGVADGGVMRSDDAGATWQHISDNWSISDDDTYGLVADANAGRVYASNSRGSSYSVLLSDDAGATWSVIGGYGYCSGTTCFSSNGGLGSVEIKRLALDPDTTVSPQRLIGASTSAGLYLYDPSTDVATADPWQQIATCPTSTGVTDVRTDAAWQDGSGNYLALVTYGGTSSDAGVYLLDLTALSCTRVTGSATFTEPNVATVAQNASGDYQLLVGAQCSNIPCVSLATLDFSAPSITSWTEVLDPRDHLDASDAAYSARYGAMTKLEVSDIAVRPSDATQVVVALRGKPYFDYYVSKALYVSVDGGQTYRVDEQLQRALPNKGMYRLQFDETGAELYAATSCSSLYRLSWPY
jgi:photosystem II stability/assembly factor-like uncharacterized protein